MIFSLSMEYINKSPGWSWGSVDDLIVVDRDIIESDFDVLSSLW